MDRPASLVLRYESQIFKTAEDFKTRFVANRSCSPEDHPRFTSIIKELKQSFSCAPPYVQSIEIVKHLDQRIKGLGWRFLVSFMGPPGTYEFLHKLEIRLKPDYPFQPPKARFFDQIYRIFLDDLGKVNGIIYDKDNLEWDQTSGILDLIQGVYDMLEIPLNYPSPTEEQIVSQWKYHTSQNLQLPPEKQRELILSIQQQLQDDIAKDSLQLEKRMAERRFIIANYKPLFPEFFRSDLQEEWFESSFLSAIKIGTKESIKNILTEISPNVFTFKMFKQNFCENFLNELLNYESSPFPKSRPNSMNNYGIIVDNIGMEGLMSEITSQFLSVLGRILYPTWLGGGPIDQHHAFMVQYMESEDKSLNMHVDDSEATLNICLGKEFTGCPLTFCGTYGQVDLFQHKIDYHHVPGVALLHIGRQRHCAGEITSGQRYNLIIWGRSVSFRESMQYKTLDRHDQEVEPDVMCLDYEYRESYQDSLKNRSK